MQPSSERHIPSEGTTGETAAIPFFVRFLGTGFYSGYSPIAPGTAGTLVGLIFYLLPSFEEAAVIGPTIIVGFLFGVYAGTKLEGALGHDPMAVVIDEIVGLWISLFLLPKTVLVVLGGFVIFRILDTFKPPPAKVFQRRGGGFSIMMDDVVVAIYTNLIMRLLIFIASQF